MIYMEKDDFYESMKTGYCKRRKKANLFFIFSIYIFVIFNLLCNNRIIRLYNNNIFSIISYLLTVISLGFLSYYYIAKRNYKGIKIYDHNEYKLFSTKEKLMYFIPIFICSYFIIYSMITYFSIIGLGYLAFERFYRPFDYIDKSL